VEAQPRRDLLLFQHVESGQQQSQGVAQQRAPAIADEGELAGEIVG
jgi:hypothetical protein